MNQLLFENNQCFDCKQIPVQYVSIQNAVFLCKQCSKLHQLFGEKTSYIKSVNEINNQDLILLKLGGNRRLSTLLEVHNINPNTSKLDLYFSKFLEYYRRILSWEAKKEIQLTSPPKEDELLIPYDSTAKESALQAIADMEFQIDDDLDNTNPEEKLTWEEVAKSVDIYLSTTLEKTKEYASQLNESQDMQNLKKNSTFVIKQVKSLGEELLGKVKDYSSQKKDIYQSQGISHAVKSTGNDIKKTAVKGLNYLKDLWIKTDVMKEDEPASGFIHVDIQSPPTQNENDQVPDINDIVIFEDKDSSRQK